MSYQKQFILLLLICIHHITYNNEFTNKLQQCINTTPSRSLLIKGIAQGICGLILIEPAIQLICETLYNKGFKALITEIILYKTPGHPKIGYFFCYYVLPCSSVFLIIEAYKNIKHSCTMHQQITTESIEHDS